MDTAGQKLTKEQKNYYKIK